MSEIKLSLLFKKCLNVSYTRVGETADVAAERMGSTLYLYFEHSRGEGDWMSNLDFPAKPYRRMGSETWYAHRGFLSVWKSVEDYLAPAIADTGVRKIVTVGYSHGGALAMLCHEYAWYHRADIRDRLDGYGFGAPRVFFGARTPSLMKRWERFTVVRNLDDIVTHLPPAVLGYSHVGQMLRIGDTEKYSRIDAHRPENILEELIRYESMR